MSLEIAVISALLPVRVEALIFKFLLSCLTKDKSVSKCSAVLALPPLPKIQIAFLFEIHSKIVSVAFSTFKFNSSTFNKLCKKVK